MHANNNIIRYGRNSFSLLLLFLCALLAGSCTTDGERNSTAYSLLVQADSAYVRGNYAKADSLMELCNEEMFANSKPASMYYHLLSLEQRFVADRLEEDDFSLADSLCRYYRGSNSVEEYSKALLFLGDIYVTLKDYPSALNHYLEASDLAVPIPVRCWAAQCEGDLYYQQEMFDECKTPYRQFYHLAVADKDTFRMARAALRMGAVYTIEDNVDSTIIALNEAIKWSNSLPFINDISVYAQYRLCDIYIQLGEFDRALDLMPRDSLNNRNWAYWHLGQNHLDSAKAYFLELLKTRNIYGQASYLRILSQIEMQQNHSADAYHYASLYEQLEDSIKVLSQEEDTRKMNVRYKVNRICKERDEMAQQQQITFITLIFLSGVSVLIISLLYFMWKSKVRRVSQELMQERLLRKEEESHYRLSTKNLEENEAKIKILQEQLNQAKIKNDATEITKLTLEEKALAAENLSIEAERCRSEFLIKQLKAKPLYVHIKTHAGDDKFYLTDEEWKQLGNDIDEAYNQFSSRLLSVIAVSELEMHICYLIKLGVAPKDMATMLFKSRNAITMTRQRLYKKITHKNGTAKQLDEYILAF